MADLYLVKLNLEALEALKDKAWKGKNLDVAIWVNDDVDHTDDNEKKGEAVVYVGNGKKFVNDNNPPF